MKHYSRFFYIPLIAITMIMNSCNNQAVQDNNETGIKPGDDFYQYVNDEWLKNNPIPDEHSSYGNAVVLNEKNLVKLRTLMEEAAADTNAVKGTNKQKIGDYYASGMDTVAIEAAGASPLKDEFERISNISNLKDLQDYFAYQSLKAGSNLFTIYIAQDQKDTETIIINFYQGGISLPDRDYYLNDDERSIMIRDEYVKHISKMFELLGDESSEALEAANKILKLETELARNSMSRLEMRNPQLTYNIMTADELQQLVTNINWENYFASIGIDGTGNINIAQPEFFKAANKLIAEVDIDEWKNYYRWKLINSNASYLSNDFVTESFHFNGTILNGIQKMKPRWKRILSMTDNALGEAVGELYVAKYFPPEAKEKMMELVGNLKIALKDRLQNLTWMSDSTKTEALAKLESMNTKIGYPDKWIDYTNLEIDRTSFVNNANQTKRFGMQLSFDKLGKPVDRDEWFLTPQTINAYYHPILNEVVFPAAILQPPFFDITADDATNYGAIGAVIGHEMTHGFDDQGRQFDKNGTLRDWWQPEDAEKFTAEVQPLVEQYNSYPLLDSLRVNGALTLGENIADLGGVTISFAAFQKSLEGKAAPEELEGRNANQRFFLSYAKVWRQNIRDEELINRITIDPHSPNRYRVNGVVRNMPEFYEEFDIAPDDALFQPVDQRPVIW